jgi:hypothetical protein
VGADAVARGAAGGVVVAWVDLRGGVELECSGSDFRARGGTAKFQAIKGGSS